VKQKGFSPIIVIIILALIGIVGAYYFGINKGNVLPTPTQTPTQITPTTKPTIDPTANWKTYTESSIGLTFKYPITWSATKSPGQNLNIVITPDSKNEKGLVPMQLMIDSPNEYNGYVDFTSILQAQTHYLKSLDNGAKITNSLTIGGKQATRIEGKLLGPGPSEGSFLQYTFVQLDGKVLIIQLGDANIQKEHDQILSTFKFTQ
jgi:hypothetical protein